jgi:hypothetical protein
MDQYQETNKPYTCYALAIQRPIMNRAKLQQDPMKFKLRAYKGGANQTMTPLELTPTENWPQINPPVHPFFRLGLNANSRWNWYEIV